MSPAELVAVVAAFTALVAAIAAGVVSVIQAFRVTTVQRAVDGHAEVIKSMASSAGFARGVQAERQASGAAEPYPHDPLHGPSTGSGGFDRHGNALR